MMHRCFFSGSSGYDESKEKKDEKGCDFLNVLCRQILCHTRHILKELLQSIFLYQPFIISYRNLSPLAGHHSTVAYEWTTCTINMNATLTSNVKAILNVDWKLVSDWTPMPLSIEKPIIMDGFRTAPPKIADGGDKFACPTNMINPNACDCGMEVIEMSNGCKKPQCKKNCDDGWFCYCAHSIVCSHVRVFCRAEDIFIWLTSANLVVFPLQLISFTFPPHICERNQYTWPPQRHTNVTICFLWRTSDKEKPDGDDDKEKPCICNRIYAPICGVDGTTYSNECLATCKDVKKKANGPCKKGSATLGFSLRLPRVFYRLSMRFQVDYFQSNANANAAHTYLL